MTATRRRSRSWATAADIEAEYDIVGSMLYRWARGIREHGSTRAADARTREESELIELRREVNGWVWFCSNERLHSRLGCMSPVEFREAELSL